MAIAWSRISLKVIANPPGLRRLCQGSAASVKLWSLGKEHGEYTRNPEEGQEKVHDAADPLTLERSGRSRRRFRNTEMACRPRSPDRTTPLNNYRPWGVELTVCPYTNHAPTINTA